MKVDNIVSIYRDCGFVINQIKGFYFLDRGRINYSFPQLNDIPVNDDLINSLKWRYPLTVIKTQSRIKNTYEFVLETNDYNINRFPIKKRTNIRKSLKDCVFKRPSLEDLYNFGLLINHQSLDRQGRQDKFLIDKKCWKKYITSFYNQENIFILGAYIAERMVGYIMVCKLEENYHISQIYYDKNFSASCPAPGLTFTLINQLIEKNGWIRISYGLDSIKPLPSLNRYKQEMLFQKIPATRVYVINPLLKPLLKLTVFFMFNILRQKRISNPLFHEVVNLIKGNRILERIKQ